MYVKQIYHSLSSLHRTAGVHRSPYISRFTAVLPNPIRTLPGLRSELKDFSIFPKFLDCPIVLPIQIQEVCGLSKDPWGRGSNEQICGTPK